MRARHCIMMLHNAQSFHKFTLLLQIEFLRFADICCSYKLRKLSEVAKLCSLALEVRMCRKVASPVRVWYRLIVVGPEVTFLKSESDIVVASILLHTLHIVFHGRPLELVHGAFLV